jgi:aspartyl/asparaginyl-tRNA synthetase
MLDQKVGTILSINEMASIDFNNLGYEQAWQDMISHTKDKKLQAILTIRTFVQHTISSILIKKGFLHPPTYLMSSCVDPLNHHTEAAKTTYYGQECSLMQSLIFHKMALLALSDLKQVYWISPNIRKEKFITDKKRYASEFTQIDFESTELDMPKALSLIDEITRTVINECVKEHADLIYFISGRKLEAMLEKMKIYDSVDEAKKRGFAGKDIEMLLAKEETHPFILTNLKREAYDRRDDETGKYINYDVCMPVTGEILSGAEREHTYERLLMRMQELEYPISYFAPILRLAKEQGLKKSAGAGFGIERFVRGILLLDDIKEVYPFTRVPEEKLIF